MPEDQHEQLVADIAKKYLGREKGLNLTPLGGGNCNINYAIESKERKIVIKLSKPYREYKAMSEYKKERWCLKKAHELNLPSPTVLEIGEFRGRVYMIQSYVAGIPAASLEGVSVLSRSEQLNVWYKLGEYAQKIHSVPVQGWGENMIEDGIFDGSWNRYLQYNIDSLNENDTLIAMSVLSLDQAKEIRYRFETLKGKRLNFGLCHGDIALRNAIASDQSETSLLDWGTARAEVTPHYDFVQILRDSKPDQETWNIFLDGYGMTKTTFKEIQNDLRTMNLLRSIDTLRWAIDKMPDVIPEHIKIVQEAIKWNG